MKQRSPVNWGSKTGKGRMETTLFYAEGVKLQHFIASVTMFPLLQEDQVSAKSRPAQHFWVVWTLVHAGTQEEQGKISAACCDQFATYFVDKINLD